MMVMEVIYDTNGSMMVIVIMMVTMLVMLMIMIPFSFPFISLLGKP